MFYEYYGVDNDKEKLGNVAEVSSTLNIQMTRKNKKIIHKKIVNHLNKLLFFKRKLPYVI